MSGKTSRTKGHNHERAVANAFRARWPHLSDRIRRSQQSHQAFEPDVVIEGVTLWTECQCAARPTPLAKLEQAERDIGRFAETTLNTLPIVAWRKSGERKTWATMRYATLLFMTVGPEQYALTQVAASTQDMVVTVDFDEWLAGVDLEVLEAA